MRPKESRGVFEDREQGFGEFAFPEFGVVATQVQVMTDGMAAGLQGADETAIGGDLRGMLYQGAVGGVGLRFAMTDAEPEFDVAARPLRKIFGEPFVVPPKGTGLGEAAGENFGMAEGEPRGREAAEAGAGDEMAIGREGGIFFAEPGEDMGQNEIGEAGMAGEIAVAGVVIEVGDEGAEEGRNFAALLEAVQDGGGFHALDVVFAVEEEGDYCGDAARWREEPDFAGVFAGGALDEVFLDFHGEV